MASCPFCFSDKDDRAPVCHACNRETTIPAVLLQERDELRSRRDRLLAELAAKEEQLAKR